MLLGLIFGNLDGYFFIGIIIMIGSLVFAGFTIIDGSDILKDLMIAIVSFCFGIWLSRSSYLDYQEYHRKEAIKEEQRKKGLRK